ncbi:hypothetical protein HY251_21535 [bacterium]|nr:hypothetical protein [bacterium]
MKVPAYRVAARLGSATIFERVVVEVPLRRVLHEMIGSPLALTALGLRELDSDGGLPQDERGTIGQLRDGRLCIREECGELRAADGFVSAEDPRDADELLRARCAPAGEGALAELLRMLKTHPLQGMQVLTAALRPMYAYAPPYSPQPGADWLYASGGLPAIGASQLPRLLKEITVAGEAAPLQFVRSHGGVATAPLVMHAPGGRLVPRLSYLVIVGEAGARDATLLTFDGEHSRTFRSRAELPPCTEAMLDAHGSLWARAAYDVAPHTHLVARCLVRVPPRAEVEGSRRTVRVKHRALASPAYVLDPRFPIPLTGREPVLGGAPVARTVLARTTRGIYLPAEPPGAGIPLARLADNESWLVLADPGAVA